jgi:hypothetical protein
LDVENVQHLRKETWGRKAINGRHTKRNADGRKMDFVK